MEPKGTELISRYKRNLSIPVEVEVTEERILAHWELEKTLAKQLLESTPENRYKVFERCYSLLYKELEWMNCIFEQNAPIQNTDYYQKIAETIGSPPKKIYEVGSGTGKLLAYLARCGFECKGIEITSERGEKNLMDSVPNLSWGSSDGVHLDRFEQHENYDVVLSDQVIEHLHPDDLNAHLQSSYNILVKKGRYIINTPHRYTGPHDISWTFKCDKAKGVHLKEYTYRELFQSLKVAGFNRIYYVSPSGFRKLFLKIGIIKEEQIIKIGVFYLNIMLAIEKILGFIQNQKLRRLCIKGLKKTLIFRDDIFLVAEK
jgi:SAM-dependent methyltransferase